MRQSLSARRTAPFSAHCASGSGLLLCRRPVAQQQADAGDRAAENQAKRKGLNAGTDILGHNTDDHTGDQLQHEYVDAKRRRDRWRFAGEYLHLRQFLLFLLDAERSLGEDVDESGK